MRSFVIISSSLLMDITFIVLMAVFVFKGKTPRVAYAVIIFYGCRAICQNLFFFQFPENWIFTDPGFFSLLVPYDKTSDFYFSGHVGFLAMSTLELVHIGWVGVAFLNFVSMIYTAWMLITLRAHYSIGRPH